MIKGFRLATPPDTAETDYANYSVYPISLIHLDLELEFDDYNQTAANQCQM